MDKLQLAKIIYDYYQGYDQLNKQELELSLQQIGNKSFSILINFRIE